MTIQELACVNVTEHEYKLPFLIHNYGARNIEKCLIILPLKSLFIQIKSINKIRTHEIESYLLSIRQREITALKENNILKALKDT